MMAGIQELLAPMALEAALDEIGTALKKLLPTGWGDNTLPYLWPTVLSSLLNQTTHADFGARETGRSPTS